MSLRKRGLRAVTVYGESDRKEYIVETLGCGCAFLDFDNDGWLDIFLLSGTRFADAPPAPAIVSSRIIATEPSPMLPSARDC